MYHVPQRDDTGRMSSGPWIHSLCWEDLYLFTDFGGEAQDS